MSIEEIRNKISVINAETARLNTQRNQNIGRQEALKKQLDEALNKYKENFGVVLTVDNLQAELDSVTRRKEEELSKIEEILNLIHAGNITEANKLAGVVETSTDNAVPSLDTTSMEQGVSANVTLSQIPSSTPETKLYQSNSVIKANDTVASPTETPVIPPVSTVIPPIASPTEASVIPPVPPTGTPVLPPVAPPQEVLTSEETLDMGMPALEGFTKPNLGSITPPSDSTSGEKVTPPNSNIQDFSAILNGTAFQPK